MSKFQCLEQVGFAGIDGGGLRLGDGWRDESFLGGVGMNAVVELGKGAVEIPRKGEAAVLVFLEPLEFLDEVELELDRDPGGEFESNVIESPERSPSGRAAFTCRTPGAI